MTTTKNTTEHRLKFTPGQIVSTPGALKAMTECGCEPHTLIDRHLSGDWGDLDPEDAAMNDLALTAGEEDRILSSYLIAPEVKVWVITEWDRSVTTLLLPSRSSTPRVAPAKLRRMRSICAQNCGWPACRLSTSRPAGANSAAQS